MSLFVIPVPQPPAGVDWQYTVPGQYIEHITAISATLGAGNASASVAVDSSGNGRDGAYNNPPTAPVFTAGLLPAGGDAAVNFAYPLVPSFGQTTVDVPLPAPDFGNPFTFEMWVQGYTSGGTIFLNDLYRGQPTGGAPDMRLIVNGNGSISCNQNGGNNWQTAAGAIPDGNPHYLVVVYQGGLVTIYVDNVQLVLSITGAPFLNTAFDQSVIGGVHGSPGCAGILDEVAIYDFDLDSFQIGRHYAAASVSFAAYSAAVIADTPYSYYHLDDGVSTPAQVDLVVTDGTHTVLDIPTGFTVPTSAAPWGYSWQPNLNSSTETSGGTLTTVAIPDLILPAGYTIGTRTPGLAGSDQWSDINIWWDDTFMQIVDANAAYHYPPGAYYVYQQVGV